MREHGRVATYAAGCRCDDCRRTSAEARRMIRQRDGRPRRPFTNGRPDELDPMSWADHGSCRDEPTDVFFPTHQGADYSLAKMICAGCDVRPECLDYAMRTRQPDGCWGGLSPDERFAREGRGYAS